MFLAANLSLMFNEVPLLDRFAAAKRFGFEAVEVQFPYAFELETLCRTREAAGVQVILINVPPGDTTADEVGLAALPGRESDFRAAVDQCALFAEKLRVRKVNVLSGKTARTEQAWQTLTNNLRHTASVFEPFGVAVQIEPLNREDHPDFFIGTLDEGLEALDRAHHPNLYLQFDLYRMARSEPDLVKAIHKAGTRIGHVQFADLPGRHEPGTGRIDFAAAIKALQAVGYDDCLAAEYTPMKDTEAGLTWLAEFNRLL